MAVIQTMGLSKRYKDRWAVDHLNLQVEQGDIYGFIGRNGAGKSTTLKLLCGLARPTQGGSPDFREADPGSGGLPPGGVAY